jgi:hypothetical protein
MGVGYWVKAPREAGVDENVAQRDTSWKYQMANGKYQISNGKWQMANGKVVAQDYTSKQRARGRGCGERIGRPILHRCVPPARWICVCENP